MSHFINHMLKSLSFIKQLPRNTLECATSVFYLELYSFILGWKLLFHLILANVVIFN